jgi:hypothetical protein
VFKEKIGEMKADQGGMAQLLEPGPSYLGMKNTRSAQLIASGQGESEQANPN